MRANMADEGEGEGGVYIWKGGQYWPLVQKEEEEEDEEGGREPAGEGGHERVVLFTRPWRGEV